MNCLHISRAQLQQQRQQQLHCRAVSRLQPCCKVAAAGSTRVPHRHSLCVAATALKDNPQNTPNPQVVPSLDFTPQQALQAQLEAISRNDEPWSNHGVQTMYEFAEEAGGMERSRYFGFSKDLYHLDHFLIFKTKCAELVDCQSYSILAGPPEQVQQQQQVPPGMQALYVSVVDSQGRDGGVFEFVLAQKEFGLRKGCWMTKSCLKVL
uniref:Uncharacterized protein n=1 Tax=Tetradesmus obliquus TaxID=3088 RepID=A0A383VFR9_TETOB|eukprot:jgi/Sobl393_1/5472/SZX64398.1